MSADKRRQVRVARFMCKWEAAWQAAERTAALRQ